MIYMLDTDTASYLMKKNSPFHRRVLARLEQQDPSTVCISVITMAELSLGVNRLVGSDEVFRGRIHRALNHFLTAISVLQFTGAVAETYGKIRSTLMAQGTDIGIADSLIASHALVEELILVTNNTRHFERVPGLRLENWAKDNSDKD